MGDPSTVLWKPLVPSGARASLGAFAFGKYRAHNNHPPARTRNGCVVPVYANRCCSRWTIRRLLIGRIHVTTSLPRERKSPASTVPIKAVKHQGPGTRVSRHRRLRTQSHILSGCKSIFCPSTHPSTHQTSTLSWSRRGILHRQQDHVGRKCTTATPPSDSAQ